VILLFSYVLTVPTPSELASEVVTPVFSHPQSFLVWDYGGAIIVDTLWQFVSQFQLKLESQLNSLMNELQTNSEKDGYKILHDIKIPFGSAIGDSVGLFPIAYLSRVQYYNSNPDSSYNNQTDLEIATKVASTYIIPWPKTLSDGTFSRSSGWSGEPSGDEFLWDDDQYMGLTLLARLSVILKQKDYAQKVGKMQLTYAQRLEDTDSVFWHGFNEKDGHHSCCKWGRANGWVMMSHVESLIALDYFSLPDFTGVLTLFQKHSQAIVNLQSEDGRWHQVLNDNSTFLETSASAMFLWSFAEGVTHGWLEHDVYGPVIEKAWNGLVKTIQTNGTVTGISEGTGIGTTVSFYNQRSTNYLSSSPGLGSVFKAIVAYDKFKNYLIF